MPYYKRSAVTAKSGINFVRTAVEDAGSLFIKIEQENDLGIDALFELIKDEKPLNKQIAVQIKSGQSYYNPDVGECVFPIGDHGEYWSKHPLPVFGIVYVPTLKTAHWIDIKRYLKSHPESATVRYRTSEANRFDATSFTRLFVPAVAHETPSLSLAESFALARSEKLDEQYLGLLVLFRRFPNVLQVWDEFAHCLRERPKEEIPILLVYALAHVPGHGDIFYFGEQLTPATRAYAHNLLSAFGYVEVVKLLSLIDPENSISRGSVGQSVEAIVSSLPRSSSILEDVIKSADLDVFVRECAALIFAMNEGKSAIPLIEALAGSGSWYASEIIAHLNEYGSINPYA